MRASSVPTVRAEILSIGTELLLGEIVDTNAAYLARRLAALGLDLFHISSVGDNLSRCSEAIDRALSRADLLITTGGLGPTEDDLTREAIAKALGETPRIDARLEAELRAWFAQRGLPMPERNVKQAWLIPSATAIPNPNGTAPGWWVRARGKEIVSMPGVPREMTAMWEERVEPALARRGRPLVTRTLKLLGIGESAVEEALGDLVRSSFPTVATYAKADGVHVRIAARATDRDAAAAAVRRVEDEMRKRIGEHVWGADADELADVIARLVTARGWRVAVHERGTYGAVSAALASAWPSPWFAAGALEDASVPETDVLIDVEAGDGTVAVTLRTPEVTLRHRTSVSQRSEATRRATLTVLSLLQRALSSR